MGSSKDRLEIRQLIEDWVLWRDAGSWDRFATVWHPDGKMMTTWCETSAMDFIARSQTAWNAGLKVLHTLGGSSIDLRGSRAIAQSKMQILQRAAVHGVTVDVICHGRFWDAFEKREGRWGLLFRQPIYELDHMSPVDLGATLELEPTLLAAFPEGYRHLAYLQTQLGYEVTRNLPGTRGPEVEALMKSGTDWLAGGTARFLDAKPPG